jgi:hypothetical protein
MKRICLFFALFLTPPILNAKDWSCYSLNDINRDNMIVAVIANDQGTKGVVLVAGVEYETAYKVQGFNRTWDFISDDHHYSFRMNPDGRAGYFEFGHVSSPIAAQASQNFKCFEG